jgi:hypothetical protein
MQDTLFSDNRVVPGAVGVVVGGAAAAPSDCQLQAGGVLGSLGYNLVETPAGCTGLVATDIVSRPAQLGPLASNGGPTQTHALLPGSPAINAGTTANHAPTTDQRGVARDAHPDIGAYEVQDRVSVPGSIVPRPIGVVPGPR